MDASPVTAVASLRRRPLALTVAVLACGTAGWVLYSTYLTPWVDHAHGELPADSQYAEPAFSADGRHMAYVRYHDDKFHAVLDGKAGEGFDRVGSLAFLASGSLVYGASVGPQAVIVSDGRRGETFDQVGDIVLAAGDEYFAVPVAMKDTWRIVGSRGVLSETMATPPGRLTLSADGRACAYTVTTDRKVYVVAPNAQRYGPFDYADNLSFAGSTIRYVALKDGRWAIYEGNRPSVESDYQLRPIVNADGALLGHVEDRVETSRVVFKTVAHAAFRDVSSPTVSADGQRVAYVAKDAAGATLVVDGHPTNIDAESLSAPHFDAAGAPTVLATIGPSLVLFNGTHMRPVADTSRPAQLTVSADGRHVGVGVVEDRHVRWKVFDTSVADGWEGADSDSGKIWTYLRVDRPRNGWRLLQNGTLLFRGKHSGFSAGKTGGALLISPRPFGGSTVIISAAADKRGTDTFLLNFSTSAVTALGSFGMNPAVAWSPASDYVVVRNSYGTPRLVAAAAADGDMFEPTLLFGKLPAAPALAASPLQWRDTHVVQIRVSAPCDMFTQKTDPGCEGHENLKRSFVLTADLDKRVAEAQRTDVPSPPGAREAAEAYWRAVSAGDLSASLEKLSPSARAELGDMTLRMISAVEPLVEATAARRSFALRSLKVDGRMASSTVDITAPDYSRTAAGQAFAADMFGWQLGVALADKPQQAIDGFVAIVRKHTPMLKAADAPLVTVKRQCDMTYEGDRWTMSAKCAEAMTR